MPGTRVPTAVPTITVQWEPLDTVEMRPPDSHRTMRAVEYWAAGQTIFSCSECLHWSAQVDVKDGEIIVREWHQPDCDIAEMMRQSLVTCHDVMRKGYYCAECGLYSAEEPDEKPET